jgi:hypothetical protein
MAAVFQKNTWIFGYGLNYIYLDQLSSKKLEQVVQGFRINQSGKRIDALMKTKGTISTLCFVEIKRTTLCCSDASIARPAGLHPPNLRCTLSGAGYCSCRHV